MIALRSGSENNLSSSNSLSSQTMLSKASLRRRRSKGTIAGFVSGKAADPPNSSPGVSDAGGDSASSSQELSLSHKIGGSANSIQGNQQPLGGDSSSSGKPCHSARLALMCSQNAIRMGARTQLGLCPPGQARRGLKAALRQKSRTMRSRRGSQAYADVGGYFGVDKMVGASSLEEYTAQEEGFLMSAHTFDIDTDEEASSGDDDDLMNMDDLLKEDAPALDDEKKYLHLTEPLFSPNGADSSNAAAGPMTGAGGENGQLPFNRRKLRYFDSISVADTMAARAYLRTEARKSKQKEVIMLGKRLRRIQREEKRRLKMERGDVFDEADLGDQESEDPKALVAAGVSKFEYPMTPATSAALLLESISLNPLESVEGMAKCYEGIVAAGVALLEANASDPTSPSSHNASSSIVSRAKVVAALTPLLITSLEQTSGEVILSLARIRRMCGTSRYQRRFVQRVAPSLIRPPNGAIWCLRHQNDMEPILAAAELIFDSAFEIFSKGWYERGRLLLADTKRAETLNTAAAQLRNLSTGSDDHLTLGGSLTSHGTWRASKFKGGKDASSNEQLAEWEVIAVDRQIRVSISSMVSTDWSKIVINHKDSDAARAQRSKSSKRSHGLHSSGEASPKAIAPSPPSPSRPTSFKKTPTSLQVPTSFPSDSADHLFPTNFPPSNFEVSERIQPPPPPTPPKPASSKISRVVDEIDTSAPVEFSTPSTFFPPSLPRSPTPPPRSPIRDHTGEHSTHPEAASPIESQRSKSSQAVTPVKESISNQLVGSPARFEKERAPLSPSSPSAFSNNDPTTTVPHRPISSASSIVSTGSASSSQPSHYRMLTSTAAERKRTVAACRALRAQITRFEDAFIQLHGRPPKGAAERAPLATTYAQYREWKRAIRADAACRIQALFRGARARWTLSRSNDPQMLRVVKARAGRASSFEHGVKNQAIGRESSLARLQIPAEIGDAGQSQMSSDPFLEIAAKSSQTLPPQWGGSQNIRRPRPANDGFTSPVPKPLSSSASGSPGSANELNILSPSELQARKRDLKQQLKQYDMNFARRHGRMPVKAEKEPIRHLYEKYNALKSQITLMEQEGRQTGPVSPVAASAVLPQRTMSPVSGLDGGSDLSPVALRGRLKPVNKQSPPSPPNAPTGPLSQDLAALKAEKGRLHQMLRSYEKDFYKEHKRQVSSFADIRPVASQYRRYKEIKKAIAGLQQGGEK